MSEGKEEGKKKNAIVLILVGAPGSGKSTFCDHVMSSSARPWVRICQDTIGNGKAGTKAQCLSSAASALQDGKSVFIDRCNLDIEQRADFVKLGGQQVDVHAVVLNLPARLCISRSVKRSGHEGNLQGGKAAAVVNRMLQKKELPKLSEGFSRITFCENECDVQTAIGTYSALGPLDTLPSGCFGQKNPDKSVQLGIMKFLKKVDTPSATGPVSISQGSTAKQMTEGKNPVHMGSENYSALPSDVDKGKDGDNITICTLSGSSSSGCVPTLAFPSISTADFQFNLEKASDIIVEKVEEFLNECENARLVLVDLSHSSKILSLVRYKAAKKNIDSNKFLTFVGDITQLHSEGGLQCTVIANAANWRLKPGGGGVNAAIFRAAGPSLEIATKELAASLNPGEVVIVPLPPASPLLSREGITHVIHVLGPNMNPQRPNCLNNDYVKGCKILSEAYSSLFAAFACLVKMQDTLACNSGKKLEIGLSASLAKRETSRESDRNKKSKGFLLGSDNNKITDGKETTVSERTWGPWAQALHNIAMHPEQHRNDVIEILDDVVVLNDAFPKAQKHILVLARVPGIERLADVRKEHLPLLNIMHAVGLKWIKKFLTQNESFVFRLGYHSEPSMRQLHLHVISQDFDSKNLKNKKHWNSFNSPFFRDSVDVVEEVSSLGKATIKDDDSFRSMELRCNRCRSAHPNLPRLKSHISKCQASFPADLLKQGRLIFAPNTG